MKILFVNGAHPDDKIGGAELQSWLLATELGRRHEVTYLAVRSDVKVNEECELEGVTVIKLAKKKKYSWKELNEIYFAVKAISPELIHLRMFEYIFLFAFLSRSCRIPVVYHVSHVFDCQPHVPNRLKQVFLQLRHAMNYFLMGRLAGLICQTTDQKNLLDHRKLPLAVVSNSAASSSGLSLKKDQRLVLWVGNIKSVKRPLLFAELAEFMKGSSFQFLMIGYPQDQELAERVRREASRLENLRYIPGIPFKEVDKYFHTASIYVSTSLEEGYPNTFIQAIQGSTPIVSLGVNPDDTLTRYEVGICSQDIKTLCRDLSKLMSDNELLGRMQQNTKACLSDMFDIARNGHAVEEYFKRLIATDA